MLEIEDIFINKVNLYLLALKQDKYNKHMALKPFSLLLNSYKKCRFSHHFFTQ